MAVEFRDCPNHGLQKVIRTEFRADPNAPNGRSNWQQLKCGETFPYEPPRSMFQPATPPAEPTPDATTGHERIVAAVAAERSALGGNPGMLTSNVAQGGSDAGAEQAAAVESADQSGQRATAADTIRTVDRVQDAALLDQLATEEREHADGPRKTVMDAIDRRRAQLSEEK